MCIRVWPDILECVNNGSYADFGSNPAQFSNKEIIMDLLLKIKSSSTYCKTAKIGESTVIINVAMYCATFSNEDAGKIFFLSRILLWVEIPRIKKHLFQSESSVVFGSSRSKHEAAPVGTGSSGPAAVSSVPRCQVPGHCCSHRGRLVS